MGGGKEENKGASGSCHHESLAFNPLRVSGPQGRERTPERHPAWACGGLGRFHTVSEPATHVMADSPALGQPGTEVGAVPGRGATESGRVLARGT